MIFILASLSCVAADDINTINDNVLIDTSDDDVDDIQIFSLSENNNEDVESSDDEYQKDGYKSNVLSSQLESKSYVLKSTSYDGKSTSDIQNALNTESDVVYLNKTEYKADKILNITGKNISINGSDNSGQGSSSFDGSNAPNGTLLNITSSSHVTLKNINFKNFKNTTIKIDNSDVTFIGCSFTDNSITDGDGGAIYVNGGSVTFTNCNFTNNKALSSVHPSNFGFFNDDGEGPEGANPQGGAISLNNTNSQFTNCNFINNRATDGGAVYIIRGSSNFTNCKFSGNIGETIYKAIGSYVGMGVGGAVYINTGNGKFDKCTFENNRANGTGGAVEINIPDEGKCSGTFNDCTFNNNRAEYGGAISIYEGTGTITNSNFNNNKADNGAAIYTSLGTDTITGCSFSNNNAVKGGGVFLYDTKADFKNSKFNKNSATEQGGAVCILAGSGGSLDSCDFTGNTAGTGNAIYTTTKLSLNNKNNISMNDIATGTGGSLNTKLSISASNHSYGESIPVNVELSVNNKGLTEKLDVYVNRTKYTVDVVNGVGSLTLDNLDYGVYVATVNYNGLSDSVTFSVTKRDISNNINLTYKGNIKNFNVNVDFPEGTSGKLTVTVDGSNYTKDIVNNNANINIEGNFKENQDIEITYSGDKANEGFNKKYTLKLNTTSVNLGIDVSDAIYGQSVPITISLSKDKVPLTTTINVTVNKANYPVNITDGIGVLNLDDLNVGIYTVTVSYEDAENTASFAVKRNITINSVDITVENRDNDSSIILTFPQDVTGNVMITVDNENYTSIIVKGNATFNFNRTFDDEENISIIYSGDKLDTGFSAVIPVSANKFELIANDITKYYHNDTQFEATLTRNGAPASGQNVTIIMNGREYNRTTNEDGTVNLNININPGVYNITTSFIDPNTNEKIVVNSIVTVLSTISGENVVKYYCNATRYYATFLNSEGKPITDKNVTFNINGVFYSAKPDENGVASLAINLLPNDYIITAYNPYNNQSFSNNITVLSTLDTNNIVKYFHNATQFTAKVVDGQGHAVLTTVTFNINGKLYNRATDANGVATLNINLNPGDYIITTNNTATGQTVGNTVKVLPVLIGTDMTKLYAQEDYYIVHFVDGQGNAVAGKTITFNINGKFYTKTTDSNGDARLAINLLPGRYIITSSTDVNGGTAITSNVVTVL